MKYHCNPEWVLHRLLFLFTSKTCCCCTIPHTINEISVKPVSPRRNFDATAQVWHCYRAHTAKWYKLHVALIFPAQLQ